MARPTLNIIRILRETADRIEAAGISYWDHPGNTNCGHLAQVVAAISPAELEIRARAQQLDEWPDYANAFTSHTGQPMDDVVECLLNTGFSSADFHRLEYLSDITILQALPGGFRSLSRKNRGDVTLYLRTWAGLLELERALIPAQMPFQADDSSLQNRLDDTANWPPAFWN